MSIVAVESTRTTLPSRLALGELADTLADRARIQTDHRVPTGELQWTEDDTIKVPGVGEMDITELGFRQLCNKLRLPADYLVRIDPDLRAANIRRAMGSAPGTSLVRTEGNRIRGLLGPKYATVNNVDLVRRLAATYPGAEARFELTESALDLQVIGGSTAADTIPGSALRGGLHIRNSEVGLSKLYVDGVVLRTICLNGMILSGRAQTFARIHRGDGDDILNQALSNLSAMEADVSDAAGRFGQAMNIEIGNQAPQVLDRIAGKYDLTKPQTSEALRGFETEPGNRLYHVLQGITWAGTHSEVLNQDARFQLQTVAGTILSNIEEGRRWLN